MKYLKLKEIAKLKNGKKCNYDVKGIIPVYGSNGIIGYTDNLNSPENSIIIGRVGANAGSVFYSFKKHWVTDNAISVVPNINKINSFYLYYALYSLDLNLLVEGSAQPLLNQSILNSLEIRVPPLSDQNSIVEKIRTFDEKIAVNNQINDNLLELMDNLFYNFFPQINVGDDLIGSFIQNYDRFRKPLSKEQRSAISGKYRYIGAASVMDYINKYNFDGIYLLLGEDGTVIDNKGYPILQYVFGKFWPNNHTHVLKGKNISTEWLYLFFRQRKVLNIVTGAVQKKISQKNLNSLKFSHPNKEDYLKFNEIIQPLFSDIRIRIKENKRLHQLKQELLKQYL